MSDLETALAFQIKALKLPEPEREYRFHGERKWRFDFAFPDHMVAVECEGGVWSGGRHVRGQGFIDDCEKYCTAAADGWRVLRVTKEHITGGQAVVWLAAALAYGD
jgi:very-short-patch-repair endonuclease